MVHFCAYLFILCYEKDKAMKMVCNSHGNCTDIYMTLCRNFIKHVARSMILIALNSLYMYQHLSLVIMADIEDQLSVGEHWITMADIPIKMASISRYQTGTAILRSEVRVQHSSIPKCWFLQAEWV